MGYMASALVLSQEKDLRIRQEAEELISSAGDSGGPLEDPEDPWRTPQGPLEPSGEFLGPKNPWNDDPP